MMEIVKSQNMEVVGGNESPFHATLPANGISLITGEQLARELLFEGTTSAFRRWCKSFGIEPVPGRKNCYDPTAVRHRLNQIQGLIVSANADATGALARSVMRRHG